MVCHAQRITLRINAPVALGILLPEIVFGIGGGAVIGTKLAHASTAANVAGNDGYGRLINQQTALHGAELTALGLIQYLGHPAIEILQFDRISHATKTLKGFTYRPHI